ncbi:uncharacterized protein LOC110847707 [Folsomia candida]|uniref:MAPEG family protein n=1 Tax=Folsomia candida TaxID=158441 RepID=A0A226EIR2_FOLCA|nr:uncharacterized protein LOC110847707 [Folsomia candida]OXA57603.1 hypothetical protein Fcan01_06431 [Folsomia candida]
MEEMGSPPPLSEQEKKDNKTLMGAMPFGVIAAFVVIAVTGGLTLSGTINLAGRTDSLPDYGSRMEFTFKYLTLPAVWMVVVILNVIFQRSRTGALNPLNGRDIYFQKQANILQNSFEQFILSAFAQAILVAFINEQWTLRTIPWVNFLFVIGRIEFAIGYPNYRTFGMFCGFIPTTGMLGVAVYKFVEHLFF